MGCFLVTTEKDLNQMKQRVQQQVVAKKSTQTKAIQKFVQTATILAEQAPSTLPYYLKRTSGMASYEMGKLGEQIAEKVLEEREGLKIVERATVRGVDIQAERPDKTCVEVEVKTSVQDKSFSQLLGMGYGHKQCSDGWLHAVGINPDPAQTDVLGVHINPDKETVTIYRRLDGTANNWRRISHNLPLSQFKL